jgi:hypothetical protein
MRAEIRGHQLGAIWSESHAAYVIVGAWPGQHTVRTIQRQPGWIPWVKDILHQVEDINTGVIAEIDTLSGLVVEEEFVEAGIRVGIHALHVLEGI